jgi:diacylglycerol kinase family enzyme
VHEDGELYFINLLSVGFVADVATTTNRRFKQLGAAGYALSVVLETAGLAPRQWHLRLPDGKQWDPVAVFLSFNNSRFTGGSMEMAPYAKTDDGKLDVIVAGPMSRSRLLLAFPRIFRGTHVHMPEIQCAQVERVELEVSEACDLMIDGEVKRHRPLRLEVVPKALEVCA